MNYKSTIRFSALLWCLLLVKLVSAATVIDSVRTTESTCGNNGTITVSAHTTNPPLVFSIISGPSIKAPQSSNVFGSLDSGSYKVLVVGAAKDSAFQTIFVPGTYRDLFLNPIVKSPVCGNSATGSIIGNVLTGLGRKPFSWTLTYPNTSTVTQASDTFKNLGPGTYTLRITDSCQNFATRSIIITNPNTAFTLANILNRVIGCDTTMVSITINVPAGGFKAPYTVRVTTPSGTYTKTANIDSSLLASPTINEKVPGVTYGGYANITIFNACGDSLRVLNQLAPYQFLNIGFVTVSKLCVSKVAAKLSLTPALPNTNPTSMMVPVTMLIRDSATGVLVDSVRYTDPNVFLYDINANPLPANKKYTITIKDGCGKIFTKVYFFVPPPLPSITKYFDSYHCLDSTANLAVTAYNFLSGTYLTFISGPKNISSTKPYYQYRDTIKYPKTLFTDACNCYFIPNLGVGKYVFQMRDSCGNVVTDSMTVLPSKVASDNFSFSAVRGCPGQNKLRLSIFGTQAAGTVITGNGNYSIVSLPGGTPIISNKTFSWNSASGYKYADSVTALNPGKYALKINYVNPAGAKGQINQSIVCPTIYDTIDIPIYTNPRVTGTQFIKCNTGGYITILPDSTRGIAPYRFRMVLPTSGTIQNSNYFPTNTPGLYRVEISDACGSGSTYDFTIDTSTFLTVGKIGSSCVGGNVKLYSISSTYLSYVWRKPNGTVFTGDTLLLKPVLSTDTGTYQLTRIININGCIDSVKTNYVLITNIQTTSTKSICPGQSIVIGAKTYTLPGIYRDTFATSTCDSISILNLTLGTYKIDTISKVICEGKSFIMGGVPFTASGTYKDTFTTAGCDSIVVLNLTVTPFKRTTLNSTICANKSITVGIHTYKAAGTFQDTIGTTSCDSIVTLNLSVTPLKLNNLTRSICIGDSFRVGTKFYKTTGNFRDTLASVGCDSVVALNLTVLPLKRDTITTSICEGKTYTVGVHNYTNSGTYKDTFSTTGCDSIVTLNLTVLKAKRDTITTTICQGGTYMMGGNPFTTTGVYRDTFAVSPCDSIVVLRLTVNAYKRDTITTSICEGKSYVMGGFPYTTTGTFQDTFTSTGCDSIVVLKLTVNPLKRTTITTSICANKTIKVGTHTYNSAGTYQDTIATINCDSIVTLNLTINPLKQSNLAQSICAGDSFQVGSKYYTTPGLYRDTLTTSGCDSIVILDLSILPLKRDTIFATIRQGQSYTVGIHSYTLAGVYRDTFATSGCDSILLLDLTVFNAIRDTLNPILCEGDTFFMGGNPYTSTGLYIDTFAANPSDSIVVLNLTVNLLKRVTINQAICEGTSFIMGGNSYNANGTYVDTLSTSGCDSIVTLNLSITLLKRTTLTTSICANKSIKIGGHTYSSAGTYSDTIATANCDSIVTLNLSITPLGTGVLDTTICAGRSITIGSKTHTAAGIYQDTVSTPNCDSIITLTLTIAPYKRDTQTVTICEGLSVLVGAKSYNQSGVYNDTLGTIGCDSIVRLYLTVTPLKRDTSNITICEGQSTVFGGTTYSIAGVYRDTFTTSTCDSISLLNLTVSPLKRVTSVQVICDGQSVQVGSNFYNATGVYKDTFATLTCDSIYTLDLTVSPLKYTVLNQNICANGSYQVGNSIYTKAGTYNDTIPTTTCDSVVTLNLSILPLIYTTIDTGICPGGSISIGNSTYTESGNYSDTISTTGCDSVVSLKLHIYNLPTLSITASSTDIIRGDTIQLSANGDVPLNYHWTGEAYFMTAFEEAPSASLVGSSWLSVTATSADSCVVIDSIFIQVRPCGNVTFYMPNAFTPNGDAKNDVFKLFGNFITLNQLQIFNRWGEMVFETPDIENGWDGTYKGVQQPTGVYIYQLNYSACGDVETKHLTGSITLIR